MENLLELRQNIDAYDDQILNLLNKRLEIVLKVGRAKADKGTQVFDKSRETAIFKRLEAENHGPLKNKMLRKIFAQIIASSSELQRAHRVAYLGPEATFSHLAARRHFGEDISYLPQTSIEDIFTAVEKGACNYGVVPVENSIEGPVNHTLDLFVESKLQICAERYQAISHDLLSKNTDINSIKTVYSHPQAFAQCRKWILKNMPEAVLKECSSTAKAAQLVVQESESAAIAGREAAQLYQLEVVASRIEDLAKNTTRFLIISRQAAEPSNNDKTSLLFVTSHVPGALYRVLQPLAEAGLNMLKLESRPTKHENWSYFFFVDVEGHLKTPLMEEAVEKLKELCLYLKCLGSYPRAQENE